MDNVFFLLNDQNTRNVEFKHILAGLAVYKNAFSKIIGN